MSDPVDPLAVAWTVSKALDAIGVVNTIGGSLAASFAGEPRSTIDIDIVASLEEFHAAQLVAALADAFYIDESSLRRAIRERTSTNLIHEATQLKVDLFVAGGTPSMPSSSRGARPWTLATAAHSTSTRRRTSCCRSCAGTRWEGARRIGSGATFRASSACRASGRPRLSARARADGRRRPRSCRMRSTRLSERAGNQAGRRARTAMTAPASTSAMDQSCASVSGPSTGGS